MMRSNNIRLVSLAVLLLGAMVTGGCEKEEDAGFNKATPTLYEYINERPELSHYRAALKKAGLDAAETFSAGGPLTVFAPVDTAFENAGLTLDSIGKYDPQALAAVLKYNILFGKISSGTLVGFYTQDAVSKNTAAGPRLSKNYYGIFFDGIPLVTGGSRDLNDGVLHELTRMALPPETNLFALISKTPGLSIYAAILKKLGKAGMLSVPPPPNPYNPNIGDAGLYYTVFAPSDEAFKKFGYPDVAAVENADLSALVSVINYTYIFPGKALTSQFKGGYSFAFDSYYVQADGLTIFTKANIELTHIIRPDLLATNGVVHIVDQVYLPN